ncbi:hypothetical protein HG535_0F04690 [Zygotorulaspora mrakii]|uniref:Activator of Hsp90 ATPase AHSA1-like N-terminal domain-containing protein n=1 Tax=Zygotorulaspora mrakii TaxID=42260 RepID=A0A7H9B5X8_ZYGMR|nr:uncharacterized protein HG535_0F04690 [Zygotorulaspora mrakii]QLG73957.1 hypothetical protein HG535_0F04690 [Zygotorulaspora mrakii]
MVVHNPNNWHWVDKNCFSWAREHFNQKLIGLNTGDNRDKYAEVSSISSIEGDCEVSQRKGKVISLFDLQLVLLIKGNVEEEKFEGSVSIPEIAFDSEEADYQFDISIYKETSKLNEIKPVIREKLVPQLRKIFHNFSKELLDTHGSAIQLPEDQVNSTFTKANQKPSSSTTSTNATTKQNEVKSNVTSSKPKNAKSVKSPQPSIATSGGNTTSIHLEPTFNVPAEELYRTFIAKDRILAWSKSGINCIKGNGPEISVGDMFELFGGNVTSELVESVLNKKLVFKWRLKDWRDKVFSNLSMEFHESKEYHETKLQVTWTGIPVGEEDRVRGNFEDYYVRSIKITFGFGAVL